MEWLADLFGTSATDGVDATKNRCHCIAVDGCCRLFDVS